MVLNTTNVPTSHGRPATSWTPCRTVHRRTEGGRPNGRPDVRRGYGGYSTHTRTSKRRTPEVVSAEPAGADGRPDQELSGAVKKMTHPRVGAAPKRSSHLSYGRPHEPTLWEPYRVLGPRGVVLADGLTGGELHRTKAEGSRGGGGDRYYLHAEVGAGA